jgi:hypothetical protein
LYEGVAVSAIVGAVIALVFYRLAIQNAKELLKKAEM